MEIRYIELMLWLALISTLTFIGTCTRIAQWWRWRRHPITATAVSISWAVFLALAPTGVHYATGVNVAREPWFGWYTGTTFLLVSLVEFSRARVVWKTHVHVSRPAGDTEDAEHSQTRLP
jgi:ABC-type molybdate transport system permease subunit